MNAVSNVHLSGRSLPADAFVPSEVQVKPTSHILRMMNGEAIGQIVHGYLSPEQCATISRNFMENTGLHVRGDDVSGMTVGADIYGKSAEQYLADVVAARPHVTEIFANTVDVPTMLRADIQAVMPAGVTVRPASYNGERFNDARVIRWTDSGALALKFHDDAGQLCDPRQSVLETSKVAHPVAFNVYVSVPEAGGELEIVNLCPDLQTKERLGIEHSGYAYPESLLADYERISIKPQVGDLLILAGEFIHGVRGIRGSGVRLLLNHFGGFIDEKTFVTWS
jgi:hypothetical protein